MNPFTILAWTWSRVFFPVGRDVLIKTADDYLRHPHRYHRPGRQGNGFNQFRNELDMDEPDDAMVSNEDLRIDQDAENLSAEAVGHPEDLFPNSFQLDQLVNIDEEMNDQADSLTGETVGNLDEKHIPPFPFWDVAEPATDTEVVGHHVGPHPVDLDEDAEGDEGYLRDGSIREALGLKPGDSFPEAPSWEKGGRREYPWNKVDPTGEPEAVGGHFFDTGGGEFNSNPETLSPINLDSALVTDAYQHQDAPGADLIAGEANQEMDPSQAQRVQYEVLA